MNTHAFEHHYLACPICRRNPTPQPVTTGIGFFTCPYCSEKLVICPSGHYVRDPFVRKQMMLAESLRRQSRPLARIIRDFGVLKRPMLAVILGSAVLLGMIVSSQQNVTNDTSIPKIEKKK
ncbi:hypothetical protein [Calothrix sp. 336/3]|uniref:hypothetical protein n=1 Tax=Calothrix sp. 336/3 TaxID=1337936 RepID=UPI0004E2C66F|nr:hypothetical protein [Calothrix sp. 336/3]AKG20730.1 hypothetical protein IJ00_04870 [Calothrix sp. 336/3]